MFMVARLFSWHYMLADTIGSLLMRHREWWSAGRCFRPCVAPHQTCLSFNVTSAINTHLFVFLSALRYLESTHRPSHNIGTLAYTYTEGPTIPVPSVYTQTAPQWRYFPSTGRSHNTGNVHLRTYGTKILVRPVYTQLVHNTGICSLPKSCFGSQGNISNCATFLCSVFCVVMVFWRMHLAWRWR